MVSSPDGCRLAFNQDSTLPSRSVVLDASSPNYRLEPLGRVYAVLASHKVVVYGGAADKLAVLSEQGNLLGRVSVPHAPMRSSAFAVLAGTSPDSFAAWDPASGDLGLFDGASSVGFVRREAPTADVSALDTTMEATFCAQPQALLTWHRPRTQNRSGWPADFTTVRARDTTTGEVMAEFSCPQGGFMPYEARCSGAGTVFVTYVGGAAALFDDEGNVRTFYRPRKGPPPTI